MSSGLEWIFKSVRWCIWHEWKAVFQSEGVSLSENREDVSEAKQGGRFSHLVSERSHRWMGNSITINILAIVIAMVIAIVLVMVRVIPIIMFIGTTNAEAVDHAKVIRL